MDYHASQEDRHRLENGRVSDRVAIANWRNYRGPGAALVLRERPKVNFEPTPRDVFAQCPKCKTVETLQFVGDRLTPSRKFRQRDGRVYHDCGSDEPCLLRR